jgi:hypothetical protein
MQNELVSFFDNESNLKRDLAEAVAKKIIHFQKLLADFKAQTGLRFTTPQYEFWYHQEYPKPRSENPEWYRLDFDKGELHFGKYAAKFCINSDDHLERYDNICGSDDKIDLWATANLYRIPLWELENANKLLDSFHIYLDIETAAMKERIESLQKRQKWEA